MCQSCVDEGALSQETYDKIEAFLDEYPSAEFGPAHIVLSDDNVDDGSIKWCLGLTKAALSGSPDDLFILKGDTKQGQIDFMNKMDWYSEDDREDLGATVKFLEELLLIPEDIR